MTAHHRTLRTRPRRPARHRIGLESESLEVRRLLAAAPINVAAGLAFAVALPVPGLASGVGVASPAPTLPTSTISLTPSPPDPPVAPTPTGPATTLSPLMEDSETANAPASEVARPTPGRSDRISDLIDEPQIVPIAHLRTPGAEEIIPGPEIQARPAAPAPPPAVPVQPPAQPQAEPAAPARAVAPPAPAPAPEPAPKAPEAPMSFETWDAALDLVAAELTQDAPAPSPLHHQGALAAGALLAAWGGWNYAPRLEGRSRRRAATFEAVLREDEVPC